MRSFFERFFFSVSVNRTLTNGYYEFEVSMFVTKWLVMTIAVFASSYVVPGIDVDGFGAAFVAALILGLINMFIRPLLVILNFPMIIVSLGFFLLVLNAILLYVVAAIVSGFYIHSFFAALIGSIFISIVSAILNTMVKPAR